MVEAEESLTEEEEGLDVGEEVLDEEDNVDLSEESEVELFVPTNDGRGTIFIRKTACV